MPFSAHRFLQVQLILSFHGIGHGWWKLDRLTYFLCCLCIWNDIVLFNVVVYPIHLIFVPFDFRFSWSKFTSLSILDINKTLMFICIHQLKVRLSHTLLFFLLSYCIIRVLHISQGYTTQYYYVSYLSFLNFGIMYIYVFNVSVILFSYVSL